MKSFDDAKFIGCSFRERSSDYYEGQQSKQAEIKKMVDSIEVKLQWCKTQRNCAKQDCDMQLFGDLNLECEKLTAQYNILMDILK